SIERAMTRGEVDLAVHSLKDLPIDSTPGLVIAAVVGPRNSGEVLVSRDGKGLKELAPGAVVGTSSLRRGAQLLAARPDLRIVDIRGNVETRIAKVMRGDYDATVLAAAGLERLGLLERVAEYLDPEVVLPAPGQGVVAVQCRERDWKVIELLAGIDDRELRECSTAERSFLKQLGGGCSAPVAALAVRTGSVLHLTGRIISLDGTRAIEVEESGGEPEALGARLADRALEEGAGQIMKSVLQSGAGTMLSGKRVVVTRPRPQNREIFELLEAQGAETVEIPVTQNVALEDSEAMAEALVRLAEFDWLVFTSRNAVDRFSSAAQRRGIDLLGYPGKVGAVGPSTAAALESAGFRVALVSRGQTGRALAEEMELVGGARVLHACAMVRNGMLREVLSGRGAEVTEIPVYRNEPVPIEENALDELRKGVDWVLFASGSAVRGFVEGVRAAGCESLLFGEGCRTRYACIGPTTAEAARETGLAPIVVADEHTSEGIMSKMVEVELESK
ncbi:MAG TPA: hydroxymethylbilane synthase, partial [Spirochaetia bacterium]|nr:hydroxymethylbilane synthase [Spirochaetia bacterium]